MRETTKIYLNTWGAYNNGSVGYGWMTAEEAREFIEADPERDGGEWFLADIDNYLGIQISSCDYCDVMQIIDDIETLESMEDWEQDEIVALMEYLGTEDVHEAIDKKDNYIFYDDIDQYHNSCDEILECYNIPDFAMTYFDYEAYYRDCDMDISEMSNGVCIMAA